MKPSIWIPPLTAACACSSKILSVAPPCPPPLNSTVAAHYRRAFVDIGRSSSGGLGTTLTLRNRWRQPRRRSQLVAATAAEGRAGGAPPPSCVKCPSFVGGDRQSTSSRNYWPHRAAPRTCLSFALSQSHLHPHPSPHSLSVHAASASSPSSPSSRLYSAGQLSLTAKRDADTVKTFAVFVTIFPRRRIDKYDTCGAQLSTATAETPTRGNYLIYARNLRRRNFCNKNIVLEFALLCCSVSAVSH